MQSATNRTMENGNYGPDEEWEKPLPCDALPLVVDNRAR
jgi:hypothetical protein